TEYGMSDLGPIQYEEKSEGVFLGRDYGKQKNFSDKVAHEIDEEIRKIINECYESAKTVISKNKALVELLSEALMKYETLTKEQIDFIVENKSIDLTLLNSSGDDLKSLRQKAKEKGIKGYTKMSKSELEESLKSEGE
ncbi:MAG: cell division protein FtsH, partial [Bacilli bacterium]